MGNAQNTFDKHALSFFFKKKSVCAKRIVLRLYKMHEGENLSNRSVSIWHPSISICNIRMIGLWDSKLWTFKSLKKRWFHLSKMLGLHIYLMSRRLVPVAITQEESRDAIYQTWLTWWHGPPETYNTSAILMLYCLVYIIDKYETFI